MVSICLALHLSQSVTYNKDVLCDELHHEGLFSFHSERGKQEMVEGPILEVARVLVLSLRTCINPPPGPELLPTRRRPSHVFA